MSELLSRYHAPDEQGRIQQITPARAGGVMSDLTSTSYRPVQRCHCLRWRRSVVWCWLAAGRR